MKFLWYLSIHVMLVLTYFYRHQHGIEAVNRFQRDSIHGRWRNICVIFIHDKGPCELVGTYNPGLYVKGCVIALYLFCSPTITSTKYVITWNFKFRTASYTI